MKKALLLAIALGCISCDGSCGDTHWSVGVSVYTVRSELIDSMVTGAYIFLVGFAISYFLIRALKLDEETQNRLIRIAAFILASIMVAVVAVKAVRGM